MLPVPKNCRTRFQHWSNRWLKYRRLQIPKTCRPTVDSQTCYRTAKKLLRQCSHPRDPSIGCCDSENGRGRIVVSIGGKMMSFKSETEAQAYLANLKLNSAHRTYRVERYESVTMGYSIQFNFRRGDGWCPLGTEERVRLSRSSARGVSPPSCFSAARQRFIRKAD